MICRRFTSQGGFSLVKILLVLLVFVGIILYFLPYIGGDTLSIVNQISGKVKVVVNSLVDKLSGVGDNLSGSVDGFRAKISRKIEDLSDKWNLKSISQVIAGVEEEWEGDMQKLLSVSASRGFDMTRVEREFDEYAAGEASWKRVENHYWEDIRQQTQTKIIDSIEGFRTRPLGCSDFAVELRTIWEIGEKFNEDTLEGYIDADNLTEELKLPRSTQFLKELLRWLAVAGVYPAQDDWTNDWFMQQLHLAIADSSANAPDYPEIIAHIDTQVGSTQHPIYRMLGELTIAEIYLNYDLINPAEDRFDEAIRQLASVMTRYNNAYNMSALGLHMVMGLLNERVCKNADLAIKEFKDVIAIARRLGLRCEDYSIAHYHLGVINLQLRAVKDVNLIFEEKTSEYTKSTQEILTATPTPIPTATPTPKPDPYEITIKIPRSRALEPGARPERPADASGTPSSVPTVPDATPVPTAVVTPPPTVLPTSSYPGLIKGTLPAGASRRPERDIRLRPRAELGESVRMKKFDIGELYDLEKIPDDAAREFELFLKCHNQGERAVIARFIHDKYLGR